ncbi:MAG: response regulator [Clostridiales bacterium]|nr:response regulator [Clostridiales bacterium]
MRVAIVERDEKVLEELKKGLKRVDPNYELAGIAGNGQSAYEMITVMQPNLVIMDIGLPRMNGLNLLRKLRTEGREFRVIIITKDEDFQQAKQAIDLGVDGYLVQPFRPMELKKALSRIHEKIRNEYWMQEQVYLIIYRVREARNWKEYFQKNVVTGLCRNFPGTIICVWIETKQLIKLADAMIQAGSLMEWNLLQPRGVLICQQTVEKFEAVPVRYPVELEQRMREMIFDENKKGIARQFQLVCEEMKREKYFPKEIKYSIIRFCMAAGLNYRNYGGEIDETKILSLMQQITYAISWKQIEKAIQGLERMISYEHKFEQYSTLIQKAMEIIRKEYDSGITLEEAASQLYVSEEYLSSQFKKETGYNFTETVRKYRIEKIKELLRTTKYKMNQIAGLVGYSDPKYMSKVFKEEEGILPTEYRRNSNGIS